MKRDTTAKPFDRLVLRNVRCFEEATIVLDPKMTVLLGENGSGKTTVVEALASLTWGDDEGLPEFPLSRKARSGEMALYEKESDKPAASFRSGRAARRRLPNDRYLLAYGRYRRVFFPDSETETVRSSPALDLDELARRASAKRTSTLFRPDNGLLRDLSRYLAAINLAGQSDPRLAGAWNRLDRSLAELGQGIAGIKMERGKYAYVPKVICNGIPLDLRELSDGYQALLVIVFDLVLRYFYQFSGQDDPLLASALVVIDEVDLHLHPRWQRTVAAQLTTLFPNTQFVLTTHSPAIVQGAIDSRRKIVTLRKEGGRAVARTLSKRVLSELEGAGIGSVLLEEKLFGVTSRYSPKYSQVEERVARLQERIERGSASDEERRQLFADMEQLQKLMVADEERRADGSYLSRVAELRVAFLRDLADEIRKAKK